MTLKKLQGTEGIGLQVPKTLLARNCRGDRVGRGFAALHFGRYWPFSAARSRNVLQYLSRIAGI